MVDVSVSRADPFNVDHSTIAGDRFESRAWTASQWRGLVENSQAKQAAYAKRRIRIPSPFPSFRGAKYFHD
jgi:hypothetical protein